MNRNLAMLAMAAMMAASIFLGGDLAQAGWTWTGGGWTWSAGWSTASGGNDPSKDRDGDKKADFSLFTTEATNGVADDFVTCTATRPATLHITATNFDTDENRINIVFADGDLVTIRVPTGQSFSVTQVIGTNRGIDDVIKIDPLDQDGDVNPMVGWVSIRRAEEGAKVACKVTTFSP